MNDAQDAGDVIKEVPASPAARAGITRIQILQAELGHARAINALAMADNMLLRQELTEARKAAGQEVAVLKEEIAAKIQRMLALYDQIRVFKAENAALAYRLDRKDEAIRAQGVWLEAMSAELEKLKTAANQAPIRAVDPHQDRDVWQMPRSLPRGI